MQHTRVQSSNLRSVGYDPETQTLEVTFTSGTTYAYAGVPAGRHAALMAAPSAGSYFATSVKNAYPATRR